MTRIEAETILKKTFGLDRFYDEQWAAIEKLLSGQRVLLVQKTGFGKSLCYQFPAILFPGTTVVFSPLIALMRDQVKALRKCGVSAACINSGQTPEENAAVIRSAEEGRLKILYIAPERQDNTQWLEAAKNRIRFSMIVVDEAHAVSVWGHDFRPAFRRIVNLVRILGESAPVLAVTATATKRVQEDVRQQLGGRMTVLRGSLVRDNFRLRVVRVNSEDEKMVWLKNNVPRMPGIGFIYAGTRVQSENYAKWLSFAGISAAHYNASLDSETRKEIEEGMMANRWKCIVATNALGMGIDKPDIRFVVHVQMPSSVVHYYQEIGRAGRDGEPTDAVLLYNGSVMPDGIEADMHLPLAFIEGSKPSPSKYFRLIEAIKEAPCGIKELCIRCNLKQDEVRRIKEDLIDQNIAREVSYSGRKKYEYVFGAPELDLSSSYELKKRKTEDLGLMHDYVYTGGCRMKYLCDCLDDDAHESYSPCDNTVLPKMKVNMTDEDRLTVERFHGQNFPVYSFSAVRGQDKIRGVAASYYGVTAVGSAIHRCKYGSGGDFPDFLVTMTLKAFRKFYGGKSPDCVTFVPPTKSGPLVERFAAKIGACLRLPVRKLVRKTRITEEQKTFTNSYGKADNVSGAFAVSEDVEGLSVLLIDDVYDSGWTVREISSVLLKAGAGRVMPLVIAKTVSEDI